MLTNANVANLVVKQEEAMSAPQHHDVSVHDTTLHVVTAGPTGAPPILLVHGFPESSWAFHRVVPLIADRLRVVAVDLRGFGASATAPMDWSSRAAAEDLHALVTTLDLGPVHLAFQDIAGGTAYRLATAHPDSVRSLIATEAGLAGFGLEGFADVLHGGSWHIGALVAPGIPELLLSGREHELLAEWAFPTMTAVPDAVSAVDVAEFARGFARTGGWNGAVGLYRSMLTEGDEFRARAARPLHLPALAIGGSGGPFTEATVRAVTDGPVTAVVLDGVGHHVTLESPDRWADAVLAFTDRVDRN
jgi:pimeloyl-ACP methyl ester carboxylesterase